MSLEELGYKRCSRAKANFNIIIPFSWSVNGGSVEWAIIRPDFGRKVMRQRRRAALKFSFSEKATKICAILLIVLTFMVYQANFCGLLRKAELYCLPTQL